MGNNNKQFETKVHIRIYIDRIETVTRTVQVHNPRSLFSLVGFHTPRLCQGRLQRNEQQAVQVKSTYPKYIEEKARYKTVQVRCSTLLFTFVRFHILRQCQRRLERNEQQQTVEVKSTYPLIHSPKRKQDPKQCKSAIQHYYSLSSGSAS